MVATADATIATPIDWDELRALHVKGISLSDLSKRYNVSYTALRSRSSREKWCNTVALARDAVTQCATDDLQASVRSWLGKIDQWGHKVLDSYMKRDPDGLNPKTLQELVSGVKVLNDTFRSNAGLDKQADNKPASLTINVNTGASQAPLGQVIDAELVSEQASEPAQLADAPPAGAPPADEPATQPAKRKRVR
jgi:hypothetical protein